MLFSTLPVRRSPLERGTKESDSLVFKAIEVDFQCKSTVHRISRGNMGVLTPNPKYVSRPIEY